MLLVTMMGATAEFCSPFPINFTLNPSILQMSDGCSGDVAFAPSVDKVLSICLRNATSDEIVYCENVSSGIYNDASNFSIYPSSDIEGGLYYLNISWDRIRYDDMGNPALNGKFDSGGVRYVCPTTKTSAKMTWYTGVTQGLSACDYEGLILDKNYSSKGTFSTGYIQTFVNDGCTGSSKLDDDFYDESFTIGSRVPEDNSYQPSFSCNDGVGSDFESYWNTGFEVCVSGSGYNDVLAVSSCSNGASAPSGVCTYAFNHSIRTTNFPVAYTVDSESVNDSTSGLDLTALLVWDGDNTTCWTDGMYQFEPEEHIVLIPAVNETELPKIVLNLSITDNITQQQNPENVTRVNVTISWLADSVPTNCDGGCPVVTVQVNNTAFQEVDRIEGEDLEPDTTYSAELEYQQESGIAVYSETSDSNAFVSEDNLTACGNGVCSGTESAFSCAVDCFSGASGSGGSGSEGQNTGGTVTSGGVILYGAGGHDWTFVLLKRKGIGGS